MRKYDRLLRPDSMNEYQLCLGVFFALEQTPLLAKEALQQVVWGDDSGGRAKYMYAWPARVCGRDENADAARHFLNRASANSLTYIIQPLLIFATHHPI